MMGNNNIQGRESVTVYRVISFLMMGNNIKGRERERERVCVCVTVYRVISFDKLSNDGE